MEGRRPALDATEAIQRVLDVLDEDFLDIGSPIKGTVVMSTELARFIDPTLLTLESMLFDSYCRTPTINAFSKKCRGLDQPVTFSGIFIILTHGPAPRWRLIQLVTTMALPLQVVP